MGAFLIAAEALGLGEGRRPEATIVRPRRERLPRAAQMNAAFAQATDMARRVAASR